MKFRLVENLSEDLKDKYGFSFEDLMNAALSNNGDFVLNPPGVKDTINLSEYQWETLYNAMFDNDTDIVYNNTDWESAWDTEDKFAKRYHCV